MSWNYRVVRLDGESGDEEQLELCIVHYDQFGGVQSFAPAAPPTGSSFTELQDDLNRMQNGLRLPAINASKFNRANG